MFPTQYHEILKRIDEIDPIDYGKTRNYIGGAVSRLSPYISRGVISTKQVAKHVLKKGYQFEEIESFLRELAWRDYFQQVWLAKGDALHTDLKQTQANAIHNKIPSSILLGQTGITAIDKGIAQLYETGYMHNHMRMYVASIACNIAKSHWLVPAKWMYYYLLDADWASNALSWQWVAGSFSSKKYYANQENINKYCDTGDQNTFLDTSYENLVELHIPKELSQTANPELKTTLPKSPKLSINKELPTYIYTFYNLDPEWDKEIAANRIVLLEPSFFEKYPVSEKTIEFVLNLSRNIPEIQVAIGEFEAVFCDIAENKLHFKEHPCFTHFKGQQHPRDWMFEKVQGYFPSFFQYWKKAERHLVDLTND
ncbi:MAG TPA: deoxyribodipyrimidine photolyase [Cytophagales bacterium]|nr:deoxyribodipyrimidine photolyase [Cytophagales bacterium]